MLKPLQSPQWVIAGRHLILYGWRLFWNQNQGFRSFQSSLISLCPSFVCFESRARNYILSHQSILSRRKEIWWCRLLVLKLFRSLLHLTADRTRVFATVSNMLARHVKEPVKKLEKMLLNAIIYLKANKIVHLFRNQERVHNWVTINTVHEMGDFTLVVKEELELHCFWFGTDISSNCSTEKC